MPLQPSEQLLKNGREIYLYGALGIALRIFPIKVQKLPGLDVSLGDSSGAVDLAGLLGVIVGFRLVTFISRTIEEVSRSRVGILELTRDEQRRAPTLQQLDLSISTDPEKQTLELEIQRNLETWGLVRTWSNRFVSSLEFGFPIIFGALAMVVLLSSATAFMVRVARVVYGLVS